MPEGHFVLYGVYAGHSSNCESLVMDVCYTVSIHFPIIAQCSKGSSG